MKTFKTFIFNKITLEKLSNVDKSSKPYLYGKYKKKEIKLQDYLHNLNCFNSPQLLTNSV